MRILHIIPYFYPAWAYGGTCRAAWELARATARRGHEVIVLTTDALDARQRVRPALETEEGVAIHRFRNLSNHLAWARLFAPPGFALHVSRAVREADVVHLHEYRSLMAAMALPALQRWRKPFILTAQGGVPMLVGRFALKRLYDALVGHRILETAARLHALNPMEQSQFLAAGGRAERIFVAPNGINVEEYLTLPTPNTFRQRHNIPDTAPLVLFLARVNKIKGVDFLVSAFAEAVRVLPAAVLAIAGPDDGYLPEVTAQVRALGIEDKVRFVGYVEGRAKVEAFEAADLYVLPSRYEMFAITLLEALASRAPVITTRQCGLADTLTQNQLGQIVQFGDVAHLREDMVEMLNRRDSLRADAERRREYVLANYDWDAIAEKWEVVYGECAAQGLRAVRG